MTPASPEPCDEVGPIVDAERRFLCVKTAAAIVVVVAYGMAGAWVMAPRSSRTATLLCGVAYLVLATAGMAWAERRQRPAWARLVLAAMALLAAIALVLSAGGAMYIAMPLVSMTVIFLSMRWAFALVLAFDALGGWLVFRALNVQAAVGAVLGFTAFATFVVAFSSIALKERRSRFQLARYAARIEELATANERNRIAREIHDSVGHCLTIVHVQLAAARGLIGPQAAAALQCLDRAQDAVRQGLAELRHSVSVLRSSPLQGRPFAVALRGLVDDGCASGFSVALDLEGEPRPLSPAVEFVLYRAAQEALTNVRRHSRANRVRLTLRYGCASAALQVEDDGVGAGRTDGGSGLAGLRERVRLVGGELRVRTAVGEGFSLEVEVPS